MLLQSKSNHHSPHTPPPPLFSYLLYCIKVNETIKMTCVTKQARQRSSCKTYVSKLPLNVKQLIVILPIGLKFYKMPKKSRDRDRDVEKK